MDKLTLPLEHENRMARERKDEDRENTECGCEGFENVEEPYVDQEDDHVGADGWADPPGNVWEGMNRSSPALSSAF